jgi:hypothetical protein
MALMLREIGQQAGVLAFGDAYRITFVAAIAALFLSLLLPGKGAVRADPTALMGG